MHPKSISKHDTYERDVPFQGGEQHMQRQGSIGESKAGPRTLVSPEAAEMESYKSRKE